MLILTRNFRQKIRIGDDIEIVVLGICHNQVKIGVKAPLDVSIHREEVYARILKEREEEYLSSKPTFENYVFTNSQKDKKQKPLITLKPKRLLNGETKFYLSSDAAPLA